MTILGRNFIGGVGENDQLTPLDVDSIQQDLNPQLGSMNVTIEPNNAYVADVSAPSSDTPVMRCATQAYFDTKVDHRSVRSMTPLHASQSRVIDCWTSSGSS